MHVDVQLAEATDTAIVLRCVQPIWTTKTETATRLRGRIERILDWAKVRGLRDGENPARWRGHLSELLPKPSKVKKVRHHPAMPYAEVPAFMADLRTTDGGARRALRFCILTASRPNEVCGARWPEFDLEAAVWTVPGERMEAGQAPRLPPSPAAGEPPPGPAAAVPPFPVPAPGGAPPPERPP